ncbi:MAG: mevalonate kinase [Candidatus Helarchaeota archaeon]
MLSCSASAPGKCILVGEHAVVYGARAIVTALNLRAYSSVDLLPEKKIIVELSDFQLKQEFAFHQESGVEQIPFPIVPILKCCQLMIRKFDLNVGMKVKIQSEIPLSAGLGSSAAVFVSTIKAIECVFDLKLTNEEISQLAFEIEKIVHIKPSGIDNYICTYGGCIVYSKKTEIKKLDIPKKLPLIICNSQKPRNTGALVKKVAILNEMFPEITERIFDAIDFLSERALNYLENGDLEKLGMIFNINQGLLDALGVSTKILSKLVECARENGAYGAKLTGAGGGGCIIAVSPSNKQNNIILNLEKSGGLPITTEYSKDGVKVENLK